MNGHLVDTCTISRWKEGKPLIVSAMNSLPGDDLLYVSSVTLGEIEFGHLSKYAKDPVKQTEFRIWIEKTFKEPILPITRFTAMSYSHMRIIICDNYVKNGKQIDLYEDAYGSKLGIDENDLWLVAQSHERGLNFITSDKMSRIKQTLDGQIILGQEVKITYWPPD